MPVLDTPAETFTVDTGGRRIFPDPFPLVHDDRVTIQCWMIAKFGVLISGNTFVATELNARARNDVDRVLLGVFPGDKHLLWHTSAPRILADGQRVEALMSTEDLPCL